MATGKQTAKVFKFVPVDLHKNNKNKEKPVIMVGKDGRVCRFPSVRDAARLMNIPSPNIIACLKGRNKTAGGCCWKYADYSAPTKMGGSIDGEGNL